MNKELVYLIEKQRKDKNKINPQIFIPRKLKPFEEIGDEKKRLILVAIRCGFSYRKVGHFLNISKNTVKRIMVKLYSDFPTLKKP